MFTEQQLREALHAKAGEAPGPESVLQQFHVPAPPDRSSARQETRRSARQETRRSARRHARWRASVVLLAGIGVLILIVAATVLPGLHRSPVPVASGGGVLGTWTMAARLDPPPGWIQDERKIDGESEETGIGYQPGKSSCGAQLYRRGVTPTTEPLVGQPTTSTPVQVHGNSATYTVTAVIFAGQARVSWQYNTDAWAALTCQLGPKGLGIATTKPDIEALVLQLAESVTLDPQPLSVPIGFSQLPAGYTVSSAYQSEKGLRLWRITLKPTTANSDLPEVNIHPISPGADLPTTNTSVGAYPAALETQRNEMTYHSKSDPHTSLTALYIPKAPVPVVLTLTNADADNAPDRGPLLIDIATKFTYATSATDTATWLNAATALNP